MSKSHHVESWPAATLQDSTPKVITASGWAPNQFVKRLDRLDAQVSRWMARHGVMLLRASLGIIFLWFGALKLFPGMSPAEGLVGLTVSALSGGHITPQFSVPLLGVWECLIGVGLLSGRALRLTLIVLFAQMAGTVTPLALVPHEVFVHEPFVLTMEGQYIIKNIVLISAAIVIGGTVRGGRMSARHRVEP